MGDSTNRLLIVTVHGRFVELTLDRSAQQSDRFLTR